MAEGLKIKQKVVGCLIEKIIILIKNKKAF